MKRRWLRVLRYFGLARPGISAYSAMALLAENDALKASAPQSVFWLDDFSGISFCVPSHRHPGQWLTVENWGFA